MIDDFWSTHSELKSGDLDHTPLATIAPASMVVDCPARTPADPRPARSFLPRLARSPLLPRFPSRHSNLRLHLISNPDVFPLQLQLSSASVLSLDCRTAIRQRTIRIAILASLLIANIILRRVTNIQRYFQVRPRSLARLHCRTWVVQPQVKD